MFLRLNAASATLWDRYAAACRGTRLMQFRTSGSGCKPICILHRPEADQNPSARPASGIGVSMAQLGHHIDTMPRKILGAPNLDLDLRGVAGKPTGTWDAVLPIPSASRFESPGSLDPW